MDKRGGLPAGIGTDRTQGKPFLLSLHQLRKSGVDSRRTEDRGGLEEQLPTQVATSVRPRAREGISRTHSTMRGAPLRYRARQGG